jgi:DHA3 family tetracycline resistance protein-like MFS transporter
MTKWKATTVWYVLEFLLSAPNFIITAVYFVRDVHMSPLQLVLTGTVMEIVYFLSEIPTGVVADTYGRRRSLIVAFLITGGATILVGLTGSFVVILIAWAIWGFGATFESGAYEAWITDEVGAENVGPVFLRGTRIAYVGGILGLFASVLIALWSLRAGVIFGGALTVLCGVIAALWMPETGFTRRPHDPAAKKLSELAQTAGDSLRFVRARHVLLLVLAIAFFSGMSSEAFDRLWEAHFIRDVGLPSLWSLDPVVWFGIFGVAIYAIGFVASTYLIKRFTDAKPETLARLLFGMTAALMVSEIVFGLAGTLYLALCALLVARAMRALVYPIWMTWLNGQISDSSIRATVISITGQADAIGQAGGGPVLGAIGNGFGIRTALTVGGLVLAPALALYGRAIAHHGREELEPVVVPP